MRGVRSGKSECMTSKSSVRDTELNMFVRSTNMAARVGAVRSFR